MCVKAPQHLNYSLLRFHTAIPGREFFFLIATWLLNSSKWQPIQKGCWKNFNTAPYLVMHAHLIGDTPNSKAPIYGCIMKLGLCINFAKFFNVLQSGH